MKRILIIIFWFALLILFSFNFYYVFPTGANIHWNGATSAIVTATIGTIALMFLCYRKIESIIMLKGWINTRIRTAFDYIPAILLLLFITGGQFVGDRIDSNIVPNSEYEFT